MIKYAFNGNTEDRRTRGHQLHYEGVVLVVQDKSKGRFHTSYVIHLHDGHGKALTTDRTVPVVGEFNTEEEALNAGLEHAKHYFH